MKMLHQAPTWLLFAALAIPLLCVAWSSRRMSRDIAASADFSPKTVKEGPVTYSDDGSHSQTITVSALKSVSGSLTIPFGPISISANAREWAANAVLLGMLLVLVGLIGLLHFPTNSAKSTEYQPIDFTGPQFDEGGEQSDAPESPSQAF
ncbi:hypothetical protein LOC71_18960 [Rhodopirellula sp. JC740]|uniref:Uncharacterized protein n=1 Tax=Rhodopirellula halodulae TaxID=2894198 RepID=A0ABS8NLB5_9BACT|nr:hypothetical protein [Rhodopirellula sp. JC740]MCC9644363.1 hypothetical protein [Rhodopirellula sp. JC740]